MLSKCNFSLSVIYISVILSHTFICKNGNEHIYLILPDMTSILTFHTDWLRTSTTFNPIFHVFYLAAFREIFSLSQISILPSLNDQMVFIVQVEV